MICFQKHSLLKDHMSHWMNYIHYWLFGFHLMTSNNPFTQNWKNNNLQIMLKNWKKYNFSYILSDQDCHNSPHASFEICGIMGLSCFPHASFESCWHYGIVITLHMPRLKFIGIVLVHHMPRLRFIGFWLLLNGFISSHPTLMIWILVWGPTPK